MRKEIAQRIAIGVAGVSLASFGITLAGSFHEANATDQRYKVATGIVTKLDNAEPSDVRRIIVPQLKSAISLLGSESTGNQAVQPLTEALNDEVLAGSLKQGQWTQVRNARQQITAGQAAYNDRNAFGDGAVGSFLGLVVGGEGARIFRNKKQTAV